MGKTKWQAALEGDFQQMKSTARHRKSGRDTRTPSASPAPSADGPNPEEVARMLGVRLQRLWVALKFRWYYAKRLLSQGSLILKIGLLGTLSYLMLFTQGEAGLPPVTTEESRPVVRPEERGEGDQPMPMPVEASEPARPDKPGGRKVLLPDADKPAVSSPAHDKPTAQAPPPPSAGSPQRAIDPTPIWVRDVDAEKVNRYVERFSGVAIREMQKFGIPASISLAQGLIESRFGTSTLAVKNNNHFGIKCFSKNCRPGHCTNLEDDHHKDFFRKYSTAWESWRAHSILISTGRYARLKKHGRNYRAWAKGLEELGYATDKNYSAKLIGVIERYNLQRFDH